MTTSIIERLLRDTQFNLGAAFATFLSRKIYRYFEAFLDSIGEETLVRFIQTDEKLLNYLPEEQQLQLKLRFMPYAKIISDLTSDQVYMCIPEQYRRLFESTPNGVPWALIQINHIQKFLTS